MGAGNGSSGLGFALWSAEAVRLSRCNFWQTYSISDVVEYGRIGAAFVDVGYPQRTQRPSAECRRAARSALGGTQVEGQCQ